jgi:hypothetical protein
VRKLVLLSVLLVGVAPSSGAAAPDRMLLITLRGNATANRTWPVAKREVGSWIVRWRVRQSQLVAGRRFLSASAVVTGTTSARGPSGTCHGTLVARSTPLALTVLNKSGDTIAFTTSPSPFARALSATCPQGISASHWPLRTSSQRKDWWLFNHPGFGFSLPDFRPLPKGGDSEGWMLAHGIHWFVTLAITTDPH